MWPEYMALHTSGQKCASKSARHRMAKLWAAWQICLDAEPRLSQTDYPQAIGFFLDSHVQLVTKCAHKSMAYVLQHNMAPEQSSATLRISDNLHRVVSTLWHKEGNCSLPIVKLLQKGLPRPRSVRYIRPQVIRCATCDTSKEIARELIINWFLGRYPHRKDVAGPERRIQAWSMSFDSLSSMLLKLPSRSLYYVIAECLAAVTISSPPLHIQAVGTVPGFAQYVHTATKSASIALKSPTVRLSQCVTTSGKRAVKRRSHAAAALQHVQQWPCNSATLTGQVNASLLNLGMSSVAKFACHACAILHVKLGKPPRAAKARMGVSIDIFDPTRAYCNRCNAQAHLLTLTGNVTRAIVGKRVEVVSMCGFCGTFTNNLKVHGLVLCCHACATEQRIAMLQNALPCPCEHADAVPSKTVFVALNNRKYILVRACEMHKHLVAASTKVAELSSWQTMFNSCTTQTLKS